MYVFPCNFYPGRLSLSGVKSMKTSEVGDALDAHWTRSFKWLRNIRKFKHRRLWWTMGINRKLNALEDCFCFFCLFVCFSFFHFSLRWICGQFWYLLCHAIFFYLRTVSVISITTITMGKKSCCLLFEDLGSNTWSNSRNITFSMATMSRLNSLSCRHWTEWLKIYLQIFIQF